MVQPFKQRLTLNLSELDPSFPNHVWTFWANPTADVFARLIATYQMAADLQAGQVADTLEQQIIADGYYSAVSELVLDTGESEFDVSTPQTARASIEASHDPALFYNILEAYVDYLNQRLESAQKKAGAPSSATVGFSNNGAKDSPSPP